MSIIDISLPLQKGMITYPKNTSFTRTPIRVKTSIISKITMGTHTGTHVDAPQHVFSGGCTIDAYNLNVFNGITRVIDCTDVKTAIDATDLKHKNIQRGERVLLKTKNSLHGYKKFYKGYVHLAGSAALYLATRDVTLVGIDFLSVKRAGSADNTPHTHLLKQNIPILEGINLNNIQPGEYILFCAPLRIISGDGAPARAGLLPLHKAKTLMV